MVTETLVDSTEGLILSNLLHNEQFIRKVIPYIKKEYFQERSQQIIFDIIKKHFDSYNDLSTKSVLTIGLDNISSINQTVYDETLALINYLDSNVSKHDFEYLIDTTERWVQDSAFFLVLLEASETIDGDKGKVSKSGIPDRMSKALSITFDNSVGHDFFDNAEERYNSYTEETNRIPFRLNIFNMIFRGGLLPKTILILMSSNTGGFKSGTMCSWAADNVRDGKKVLYISCEMSESQVTERLDANLMDIDLDDLPDLGKVQYMKNIEKIRKKHPGQFKVKEYPTATAHAGHFRYLLRELKEKQNYIPDIIYVDYLNICASQRLPASSSANSYLYIKAIAEELRALAKEFEVPVVTATQGGRQVAGASDVSIGDVSESMGITHTADYFLGVITTDELDDAKQIMYKQLKNRYGDVNVHRTFLCSVNKSRMRLYDSSKLPLSTPDEEAPKEKTSRRKGFDSFEF